MFFEEYNAAAGAAKLKTAFLRDNPAGYFVASMLAGVYVGLSIILIYSIGGQLASEPYVKLIMGVSFGISLSLVVMAGSELFTGNNLLMAAGLCAGTIRIAQAAKLWLVCYIGNWLGSILTAAVYFGTGLVSGPVGTFIATAAAGKTGAPFFQLVLRGALCNILVCLAVWCNYRCKSESGKLIMIFWCLFAFITSGYEHCIANMTLLTVALFVPGATAGIGAGGYFYNILTVTLGNMLGGILFVALPYRLISRAKHRA